MDEAPTRNWSETLDLDRGTAINNFAARMEECLRTQQAAADDLKEVMAEAKEAEFSIRDVDAMKTVARLRVKDQLGRAQEKLEALERISKALKLDLFDWAARQD